MDNVFILSQDSTDQIKRRITESYLYAKAAGGLFSVLVHPGNMNHTEIPVLENFHQSLLLRFRTDHAHSMTGAELAHWWKTREQILRKLEYGPDMWRVKGIAIPEKMDFMLSAPNIKKMKFSIKGAIGASQLYHDTLTIRPGSIDPDVGITIIKKK